VVFSLFFAFYLIDESGEIELSREYIASQFGIMFCRRLDELLERVDAVRLFPEVGFSVNYPPALQLLHSLSRFYRGR